jgi:hypothetical protein
VDCGLGFDLPLDAYPPLCRSPTTCCRPGPEWSVGFTRSSPSPRTRLTSPQVRTEPSNAQDGEGTALVLRDHLSRWLATGTRSHQSVHKDCSERPPSTEITACESERRERVAIHAGRRRGLKRRLGSNVSKPQPVANSFCFSRLETSLLGSHPAPNASRDGKRDRIAFRASRPA